MNWLEARREERYKRKAPGISEGFTFAWGALPRDKLSSFSEKMQYL